MDREKLLEVKNLRQYFKIGRDNVIKAVDDISFTIYKGETFALVGESGCGKSTTGRAIIRISKENEGEVLFKGKYISNKEVYKKEKKYINKNIQIIFQDSTSSLNPRMTIGKIISEPLIIQGLYKNDRVNKVYELLKIVGLDESYVDKYPYDLSVGQRQRICIARALALNPEFIIADEPFSSLDVSIQAQIINLFKKLKEENNLTCLLIAHDLAMVRYISDRVAVMYSGKIVELATTKELYEKPLHPYTKSLLSSIPTINPKYRGLRNLISYNPKIHDYSEETPSFTEVVEGHFVYCSKSELDRYKKEITIENLK